MPSSQPTTQPTRLATIRTAALLTLVAIPASTVRADWPTTPDDSITLGIAEATFFGSRQTLAVVETDAETNTWIAWQQSYCGGFDEGVVRLNRIGRDGTLFNETGAAVQPDPTCGFVVPPLLVPTGNAVAVTRGLSDLSQDALNAYEQNAAPIWGPGFTTDSPVAIQHLAALPSGDLIAASIDGPSIRLDRLNAQGSPVWDTPTILASPSGSNFAIRAIVPLDTARPDDGFYLVWDSPLAYTRQAFIQRIDANGQPVWAQPINPMPAPPTDGISRHTPPVAIATTHGRLLYVWTKGFETATTPAPIHYQIINPDASLAFPIEGARLTDTPERQFDPIVRRDGSTGEFSIVFRAGLFDGQSLRAQRLDADGLRLFSEHGVDITPIPLASPFEAGLIQGELHTLSLATTSEAETTLNAHQVTDTQSIRGPWPVARTGSVFSIAAAGVSQGLIVTWQQDGPELQDTLHAARLNPAGRLGAGQCNHADISAPYYVLDLSDIQSFIPAFLNDDPAADFADPSGILDLADVTAFVSAFNAGCF